MMTSAATLQTFLKLFIIISISSRILCHNNEATTENASIEVESLHEDDSEIYYIKPLHVDLLESRHSNKNISAIPDNGEDIKGLKNKNKNKRRKNPILNAALQVAATQGLNAMIDLYERVEPEILRKGELLEIDHPSVKLSLFSAPMNNDSNIDEAKAAYASLYVAKKLQESINLDFTGLGRQNTPKKKISLRKTPLEGLCPTREPPQCVPATKRYRTHDGTCNNFRKLRWGSSHMPFHRFLHPEYSDGLEAIRNSVDGGALPSARFVSLVVHGYREDESQVTMMLLQWGQLIDHDLTATLQPRSINGSIPRCCESVTVHPLCLPMKVPRDDPFLAHLGVKCLEFLRSAPAQRRDCFLSWREQTNQVTSFIDASPVYSSSPRTADNARILRNGLLLFGRGPPSEDICLHGGFGHQCIRAGDSRAGEQPGLLALHTVFVAEHNRIALELSDMNNHWSDEKIYQETRRIIAAIFQHITYREFLPLVLGREVCRLFELDLKTSGFYDDYDPKINPTIANAFSAAAFRFGHSMVQGTILRSDSNYRFINNNVSLHEENSHGDIGETGSLHRIIRGMTTQRTLKRDEFMTPELTNHLFQSGIFPFGMDLAAINIQRGRDHGLPSYVDWREPCGLSSIRNWDDLEVVAGPNSANRMRRAYSNIEDIDLFVGGLSERPVRGGLVGPTFACIIAQQFSNLRKGDRFWYENSGFESSFTLAQLNSIRQVTLSQILCRSLGSINLLQPHSFLPNEFPGNERIRCGSGILAPMNLQPWIERDPFNKEGDFDTDNLIEPQVNIFLTDNQNSITHSTTTLNPFNIFGQFNDVTFNLGNSPNSRPSLQFNNVNFTVGKPSTNRPNGQNEVTFTVGKPSPPRQPASSTLRPNIQFNDVTSTVGKPSSLNPNAQIISNNVDFSQIVITSKPSTSKKPALTISNNVDFSTTTVATKTTKRKRKTTVTTKKPNSSIIDNKVDFSTIKTTKRPSNNPFSKTDKINSTIVRRSTDNKKKTQPDMKIQHKSDTIDLTDDLPELNIEHTEIRQKTFRNEDNATKYLDNKAITTTVQSDNDNKTNTTETLESRINHNFYSDHGAIKQYDYSYDNDYRPNNNVYNSQRPNNNFYPLYPPLDEPIVTLTTKRPVAYMNNRPNYDGPYNRPRPDVKPDVSPLSNKFSTPFSYDTSINGPTNGPSFSSSINPSYDNMAIPSNVSPNRYNNKRPSAQYYSNRPTYATTTKRADFSTFLIVETTRRTSPAPSHYFINLDRTTRRTVYKDYSISSQLLQSLLPITPADKYYSNSDYSNIDRTNLTYLISTATNNKRFTNKPTHVKLPSYNSYKPSYHTESSYEHDQDNDDFDGYLRPQNTFYRPLTNNYKVSYNDYYKPETSTVHSIKYYFKKNFLHKYHTIKSGEPKEGLVDKDEDDNENEPTKINDKLLDSSDNGKSEKVVNIARSRLTRTNSDIKDIKTRNFVDAKTKTQFGNTFFVPFKLLTRIERPDNWVNIDETTKSPLPDIPIIVNQEGNYARELPKPINAKLQKF
ncbi:unnamed protein product [Chironomus riparius]|uniref:Peroxidase n=1 Tax=Chironomus riparius TaxID=315576 RepID=A0A9N9WWW6_9DIPT|nr:unnamed protein product [Chironomus riparius]